MLQKKVLGIDIGGSHIRALLLNGKSISALIKTKTPKTKLKFKIALKSILKHFISKQDLYGVGIGIAGVVKGKSVIYCPNIPYLKNYNFRKHFPSNVKIIVENDARAHAHSIKKSFPNALIIKLGTGIGRALIKNGSIKMIRKLELPESWEKQYQSGKNKKSLTTITSLLVKNIPPLLTKYRVTTVVIGGEPIRNKEGQLVSILNRKWKNHGFRFRAKAMFYKKHSGPIGVASLLTRKQKKS